MKSMSMQINVILPYKEQFSKNKASSVSITVKNNFDYSSYKTSILVYGQFVDSPILPCNFIGIKKPRNILKSKNIFMAQEICKIIKKKKDTEHLIEVHNRPYLVKIFDATLDNKSIIFFFHNDPLTMKGSKSVSERLDLLSRVNYICCVSNFIKKQFLEGITTNSEKVIVIYNGVSRNLMTFPKKKKEIIYVGRIVKEKGVHLYVDAIKEIYSKLNSWNFKIIGSVKLGYNIHSDYYSKKITKDFSNLGERTEITGYLPQNELNQILEVSSIIVIPSLWEEPFGLVAAEAMANGIAIISSNSGALKEVINNKGILINDINKNKIVDAILKLTRSKKELFKYQNLSWNNHQFTSKRSSSKLDKVRKSLFKK